MDAPRGVEWAGWKRGSEETMARPAGPLAAWAAFVFASTWFVNMRLLEVGALYAYPVNSAILVLLCETAGCKMEQKKDTIILDE
jgi:hypothetical protein